MTSRERVLAAINHQETDRVPIDIGGTSCSAVHVDEYSDIVRYLGLDETPMVWEQFEMAGKVSPAVRQRLHGDVVTLENPEMMWGVRNRDWKPWKTFRDNDVLIPGNFNPVQDEQGAYWIYDKNGNAVAHMPKDGFYFDHTVQTSTRRDEYIGMDPEDWRKELYVYTDEHLRELEENAKFLHDNTDCAVFSEWNQCKFGTNHKEYAGLTSMEWLCALLVEEEYAAELIHVSCEQALLNAKLFLQAVGNNVDIMLLSTTDFGNQKSEFFNPDIWGRLHKPNFRKVNDYIHENSNIKTFIHTCGSIRKIIPHIIDAGFDILNPVQVTAKNMDPAELKAEFGDKITFWGGGVDTQTVLPYGTPDEVEAQVKERIEIFGKGGGYVFNPIHCIQAGVPVENLLRAVDTAYNYRRT